MATDSKTEEKNSTNAGGRGVRGPSYPALTLEAAVERAKQFWSHEKRSAAPIAAAAKHWGYSESSSSVRMLVAALLAYGLMEDNGSGDSRTVKLTGRALDILLDEQQGTPARNKALQEAARAPKINQEILSKWPDELPSNPTLRYFLLREKGFNDGAVDGYIEDFRASVAYARLDKVTTITAGGAESQTDKPPKAPPEVGDLVQWESGGVLRMDAPRRVRAKQEHEGSWWVFVEESETGVPMDEIVVVERAEQKPTLTKPPVLPISTPAAAQGVAQVQRLSAEEREWLRGTLSKDKGVNYRLIVSGDLGSKEIGKLIKLLEAQKLVLDDDE